MKEINTARLLFLVSLLSVFGGCNRSTDPRQGNTDSAKQYYVIDSSMYTEPALSTGEIEQFKKVKNLLEFHTRDSMKTDSTYIATLAMGKNTSPAEMELKIKTITEPGGKVQVRDTTQEISLRMAAVLEDKASSQAPNFLIELIGGANNIRTYDPKKNKMIWQWNVTPLKEGNHELILSISQLDSLGYEAGSPETRHHNITIFAERKKTSVVKSVGHFFEKNWQWLIGAVCIPLLIVWMNNRQRLNRQERSEKTTTKPANPGWKRKKR